MGKPRFAVSGNANLDVYLVVERIPGPDEAVEAVETRSYVGGAATNVAVALARLGVYARFLGFVGGDDEGARVLKELGGNGVDTSYVQMSSLPTGRVIVLLDRQGRRAMVALRGANTELKPGCFNAESVLGGVDHLHLSSTHPGYTAWLLQEAKRLGLSTSWDPGMAVVSRSPQEVLKAARSADVLFLNEREYEALRGGLAELGETLVVVKRGEEGSEAPRLGVKVKAFRVSPVDTTGAGDTFDASFLVAWKLGLSVEDCLLLGNAAGALKVTRMGAHSSPTLRELYDFLSSRVESGEALPRLAGLFRDLA